jgi:hypothetical protein
MRPILSRDGVAVIANAVRCGRQAFHERPADEVDCGVMSTSTIRMSRFEIRIPVARPGSVRAALDLHQILDLASTSMRSPASIVVSSSGGNFRARG